jgi:hypothetical protein
MVGNRSLQYVDGARPVFVVVKRPEDAARLDGHHPHSELAPGHAFDLGTEVDGCKQLHRNTLRFRRQRFVAHRVPLFRSSRTQVILAAPGSTVTLVPVYA